MPLVLPDEGLPQLLSYWLGKTSNAFSDWQLVLFNNNLTPDQDTVWADITQATFTGYSPVTLAKATWTSPTIISHKAVSTYDTTPILWTDTSGSETIYGYAIATPTSPVLLVIERFASPVPVAPGGIIGVLPRIEFTTAP